MEEMEMSAVEVDKQLEMLMNYTIFHIGAYMTLCSALIALLGIDSLRARILEIKGYLKVTLVCFALAGACGGLIGSSIPFYTSWKAFEAAKLGFWSFEFLPAIVCTHMEHAFFWAGILFVLTGLFRMKGEARISSLALPDSVRVKVRES